MSLNSFINYFIPEKYEHDKELNRKSKFIIWFVLIGDVVTIFFSIILFLLQQVDNVNLAVGIGLVLLMSMGLFVFRRTGSFLFITHFVCGIFFIGMISLPYTTGGVYSPDLPTLYIIPLFALIMANFRVGLFYSVLTLFTFILYYFLSLDERAFFGKQLESLPPEYFALNLILNLVLILFLVFRNENLRLKILGELKETNLIISQKSQEITDSINYAKRIQTAILPEHSIVRKHLPDSFIMYSPKDIVSGDFYWIAEKGGYQFLAIADCTGHGVPGALMSVIGVNQLNTVVLERGIIDPAEILEELDRSVVRVLKQNQAEVNDGMDVGIIRVNFKEKTIDFAGANRPMYSVRAKQLSEIKGTKVSIGGSDAGNGKKFQSNHVQMQAGDMIFLSTDGYPDQFGGDKNKKITTKNFKRLLESLGDRPLSEQESQLREFFLAHKGQNEQTDDVLVAGLKF